MANGSLPAEPVPDQRERQSIARVPLAPPPINPNAKNDPTGEVLVKPVPQSPENAPVPPRTGVGPQPTSR